MNDGALAHLREAKALLMDEQKAGGSSREIAVSVTNIDNAILWRQYDLQVKTPPKNEASE